MYKKTVTYEDYDGNERTEDLYFNLNKAEVMEMQFSWDGGLYNTLQKMINEKDTKRLMEYFKMILLKSYGEKSLDGKKFLKEDENGRSLAQLNFVPTEAYSQLYIMLATDADEASKFINGIMPKNLEDDINKATDKKEGQKVIPGPGADKQ